MILDLFLTLSLGLTAQYNVDPVVVNDAPAYSGINITESNTVFAEQFSMIRREGGGKGVIGAFEFGGTHHVADLVRLKAAIPVWYEVGASSGTGDENQFALGNVLLGANFSLPFSSSNGGWDFLFTVGVDSRIPTSTEDVSGTTATTTRIATFAKETFSIHPYAGFYGERDILSFQASVGYQLLMTDPTTSKIFRAQAGLGYHQFRPFTAALEYNLAKINDFGGVSGTNVTFQELSPSVQYDYKAWKFSLHGLVNFGSDITDSSYGGVALKAAYRY